jgi:proteic killer suppression protein
VRGRVVNDEACASLKGFWAVTVRANWRVIFRHEGGDAFDVDYLDYH